MKTMLRIIAQLFFSFVFLAPRESWSQLPAITFEVITSNDGLPSNTVLSATRDRSGFMWFGTRQCPVRYDGLTFKSFSNYTANFVTGIQADKESNIWFSSDRGGVGKIDASTSEMTPIPVDDANKTKTTGDFYIDAFGQGWFSDHDGINRIDLASNKQKHYPFKQTAFVWLKGSFVEDNNKTLWVIGRDNGLFRYDRQADTLTCVLGPDSAKPGRFQQLLMSNAWADDQGFLWIGTYNFGLIKFDSRKESVEEFATGRMANQITAVAEGVDENGKRILWVGDQRGLGIFRPEQKKFYFFPNLLSRSFEVNQIFREPVNGIVWVCTSAGIIKYHPMSNVIQSISIPPQLSQSLSVNTVHQDRRPGKTNFFYLGLSNNVMLRWDRSLNQFSTVTYPGDAADTRWIEQRDGILWIGTNRWDYLRPGIFVYDLQTEKFLKPPLSVLANTFFSVPFFMYGTFDNQKRLWVGNSDEGIHGMDENSAREITPWDSTLMRGLLKNNNLINCMLIGRDGRVWVGTYRGVFYFDEIKKKFICADPVPLPKGMDDAAVNSLMEDKQGNIWAARWGSVTMMKKIGELTTIINDKNGISDRQLQGLVEDYAGNVWIGNHEGLYCYSPTTKRLIRFTMNDGLLSNNTMGHLSISDDGKEVMVGNIGGFNVVKVDQVKKPSMAPPLVVSSFKIHEKEFHFDFEKLIQLQPSKNAFSVDFVALNFRKQDDNQYAYYLEGFEKDWNYSNSKHTAYYTNLNPRIYTLRIKAGDSYGNWNENQLKLRVEVLPAFYQTAWFKILISVFIAGSLWAVYQYRINQLLSLQRVRNSISADLHDELGSTLSGISIMGSLARKELASPETSAAFVDRMMEDVRQISGSLDDIVWNISPRNDALSSLIARMTRYASELFEAKQIQFKLVVPDRLDDVKLSMEQRRNIYLIFKESVNNLVKHSKCTHASVIVTMNKRSACLTIKDNGVGFNPAMPTDRNGLQNLKQRASSLKGILDIQSTVGEGTSFKLEFPLET